MRSTLNRHRLAQVAAVTAALALLAACGPTTSNSAPAGPPAPTGSAGAAPVPAGALVISDGTKVVRVGDQTFTFPTTVTDAAWSPDGSRIVYVDSDANIVTARIDGSDPVVLTAKKSGVSRRHPVWYPQLRAVLFDERTGSGAWQLMGISSSGSNGFQQGQFLAADILADAPQTGNYGASAGLASGNGRELAYEHTAGNTAEVWVADTNGRSPYGQKLVNGTEAALSADGTRVAYVANGQIHVVSATDDGPSPVQLTTGVVAPTHLAWTPDGTKIVFATAKDVETVPAQLAAGAKSNPTTNVSDTPGVASYQPPARDQLIRMPAADPVATSITVSKAMFQTQQDYAPSQARTVASGATLVATKDPAAALPVGDPGYGPLLFTDGSTLDPRTRDELKRTLGRYTGDAQDGPEVVLVGDTTVLSAGVASAVTALGYRVRRISGHDTASIADAGLDAAPKYIGAAVVVSADDPAGLALSGLMSPRGSTVVAVNGKLSAAGRKFINGLDQKATVYLLDAGAQAAVAGSRADLVLTPVTTPAAALKAQGQLADRVVLAPKNSPADIEAAAAYAAVAGGVVFVVDGPLDAGELAWLGHSSGTVDQVVVFDSTGIIPMNVDRQAATAVAGPQGYQSAALPVLT